MVLLIIIPTKWLFHWGYTPFSDISIFHRSTHPKSKSAPGVPLWGVQETASVSTSCRAFPCRICTAMARVAERFCPATQKKKTFPPRSWGRKIAAGWVQGNQKPWFSYVFINQSEPETMVFSSFLQISWETPSTPPYFFGGMIIMSPKT